MAHTANFENLNDLTLNSVVVGTACASCIHLNTGGAFKNEIHCLYGECMKKPPKTCGNQNRELKMEETVH